VQVHFPQAPVFPQEDGSAKLSAAWIIDHVLHLRGVREGDVGTWPTQALIVVNYGHAQAQDVLRFIERIRTECRSALGVELTPEVVFVGDDLHHA
jgi:UDP-N-acetylmuramate dehydrogenase